MVTTWSPVGPGHEVLSYGSDRPPRRPPRLLIWVAAASLAVGFLVGSQVGLPSEETPAREAAGVRLAAGAVTKVDQEVEDARFEIPLFNPGQEEVEARVVALFGWEPELAENPSIVIPPATWASAPFSAPPNCTIYPDSVMVARVRTETASGSEVQTVPLPQRAEVLDEYHNGVCAPRFVPSEGQLDGVWVVEQGHTGFLPGEMLLRFGPGSRFAIDPTGSLFTTHPWAHGTYELEDENLTLTIEGGVDCQAGERLLWTVGILPEGRLHIRHQPETRGVCDVRSTLWIARRLLDAEVSPPRR